MELRKINERDALQQREYMAAMPDDENGVKNPYPGISFEAHLFRRIAR
jgi:hypothetical protein